MEQKVVILGASAKPDRYSHKAFRMLQEYGHTPIPVHPTLKELDGILVAPKLADIKSKVDTLTMYVGPEISSKLKEEIIALKPKRVIFNPGSENAELAETLKKSGVEVLEACTLVLLKTDQFNNV